MSNMRQVGVALLMYQNEYEKTPPKTQAVYDYASPAARDNVLKLLRSFLSAEDPEARTPVYACPSLKPNPNPAYAPSRVSSTGYLVNSVVMGRHVASIPNPGRIIAMQEGWSLSNHLWVQPEPINRSPAALQGRESTRYREWHMFASQSDHSSWFTQSAGSRHPMSTTKAATSSFPMAMLTTRNTGIAKAGTTGWSIP